jgi:hypothetical protein
VIEHCSGDRTINILFIQHPEHVAGFINHRQLPDSNPCPAAMSAPWEPHCLPQRRFRPQMLSGRDHHILRFHQTSLFSSSIILHDTQAKQDRIQKWYGSFLHKSCKAAFSAALMAISTY